MFNHVMLGTNDIERAQKFYDAVLKTLGVENPPHRDTAGSGHIRLFYRHDGNTFALSQPINGEPANSGNGSTLGFRCSSPEQVKAFHETALAHGGVTIEEPPGLREGPGNFFLAYVRDPDGHKLCAIHRVKR